MDFAFTGPKLPSQSDAIICVSVNERTWKGCQSETLKSNVL